jgi:hypothetical protein
MTEEEKVKFNEKVVSVLTSLGFETRPYDISYDIRLVYSSLDIYFVSICHELLFYKIKDNRSIAICGYTPEHFLKDGELDEAKLQQTVKKIINQEKIKLIDKDFKYDCKI